MIQVINGKTYNTATMTVLATRDVYSNGNYAGCNTIRVTKSGLLAFVSTSNGQDLYRESYIEAVTAEEAKEKIDHWMLDEKEVAALTQYGVISEA